MSLPKRQNSVERADFSNRTWLCTVVFLDMVAYSQHSVTQQVAMKRRFNARLADAIAHVAARDRIVLDTGDGAALCFMGDPEEALMVALRLLNAFHDEAQSEIVPVVVRIGIHIGPVKIMKDINGQLNTIGDGINAAQRVMTFAQPNQILVSRSFYEVVACLSQEYAQMFQYLGAHTDKHVREYIIYEVIAPSGRSSTAAAPLYTAMPAPTTAEAAPLLYNPGIAPWETPWEPALLAQIEALLSKYMGPVARMLVAEAAPQTSDGVTLGERLAVHIAADEERQQFLEALQTLLTASATPDDAPSPLYDAVRSEVTSPPPAPPPARAPAPLAWDPRVLQAAQERLAQDLGPLAQVLVQRAAQRTSSLEAFYRELASHLTPPQVQQRFLRDSGLVV